MSNEQPKPQRRTLRLQGYDYSRCGAYFVTIRTRDGAHLFGQVVNGEMQPGAAGQLVAAEWQALTQRFPAIALDAFVVMPDHLHGVVLLDDAGGHRVTIGQVVGAFKSLTTDRYVRGVLDLGWPPFRERLWQRNYYEHIVRSEESLNRIRRYIEQNPREWSTGVWSDPRLGEEA